MAPQQQQNFLSQTFARNLTKDNQLNTKWVRGSRDVTDLIKKYNVSNVTSNEKKKVKNNWKSQKPTENGIINTNPCWIDDRYIKQYTDYSDMMIVIENLTKKYGKILESFSLGTSVEGRKLECIHISGNVKQPRSLLKPMVKYVANIHGDEMLGRELLIGLARHLTENYETDLRIKKIVDNTDIYLVPSINPDGYENESRYNSNEEDLNRAFPGWREIEHSRETLMESREKEVKIMMKWILDNPFVLSISFHDGRVMINYPWDDSPEATEGQPATCPDNDVFSALSSLYANNHPFMWTGKCLCHSDTFSQGISNGAEWYLVDNGMQDFNYLFSNCFEITAELSCWKKPMESQLDVEWTNNLDSMLCFLESAHSGVKGHVWDQDGCPVIGAFVILEDRDKSVVTSNRGEFWRLLLPGSYQIKARHDNRYGTIESEALRIDVKEDLCGGALEISLVCRFVLRLKFLVTGVKNGGSKFYDSCYFAEIKSLFHSCLDIKVDLYNPGYKTINRKDSQARQVAFQVEVVLSENSTAQYFEDRWQEKITRPKNDQEQERWIRRLKIYADEMWCGKRDEWNIRLES